MSDDHQIIHDTDGALHGPDCKGECLQINSYYDVFDLRVVPALAQYSHVHGDGESHEMEKPVLMIDTRSTFIIDKDPQTEKPVEGLRLAVSVPVALALQDRLEKAIMSALPEFTKTATIEEMLEIATLAMDKLKNLKDKNDGE